MGARDPYCGWDLLLKKCTTLEDSVRMSQWEQSITKCPVRIPSLYIYIIVLHFLSLYLLFFFLSLCLQTLKLVENRTILAQPPCLPCSPYEFNTYIHLCSSPLRPCSVFSLYTHNVQAAAPKTSLENTSPAKKSILGLNNLT